MPGIISLVPLRLCLCMCVRKAPTPTTKHRLCFVLVVCVCAADGEEQCSIYTRLKAKLTFYFLNLQNGKTVGNFVASALRQAGIKSLRICARCGARARERALRVIPALALRKLSKLLTTLEKMSWRAHTGWWAVGAAATAERDLYLNTRAGVCRRSRCLCYKNGA